MIYWLLFGTLGLLILNFLINNGDIFAPSCMVCLIYFLCVLLSLYNYDIWQLDSFSGDTVSLVLVCLAVFSLVCFFICNVLYGLNLRKRRAPLTAESCKMHIIPVNRQILFIACALQVTIILLCVINILRVGGGVVGWAYILNRYKMLNASGEAFLPGYVQQGIKIVTVLGYTYLFIFVNNAVMEGKLKGHYNCLIPVLLHLLRSILTGSRYNMICIAAAGVYAAYILYQQKTGWRRTFKFKYLIWGVSGFTLLLALFVLLKRAAGRTDNIEPVYYVTMYSSGCIKLLDSYIQAPIAPSSIWGKETFSGINAFLANRGLTQRYDINLEFRFINGRNIGNVYGAIRRFYQDFGFGGCLLLISIEAAVWSSIYSRLTYAVHKNREYLLILFMYMVHALVIFPIDDKFYNNLVTPSFVIYTVLFYFSYRYIVRKKKVVRFD